MKRHASMTACGREMVNLYRMILHALPDNGPGNGRVIEVIAARPREGVSTVVRILAEVAAGVGNARVVICDATAMRAALSSTSLTSLGEVSGMADLAQLFTWVPSSDGPRSRWIASTPPRSRLLPTEKDKPNKLGFSLTTVAKPGMESEIAIKIDSLDAAFAALRREFDLIVIDAGSTSQGPLGLALAKKADRVVLVVEADRTRVQVAASAQREIENNGGQMLGVVFNKHRFRMPRMIHRWLFD